MKQIAWLFKWLLKAAIFFTLFAFALNNQGDGTVHFFFGYRWTAPMVLVVLGAFAAGLVIGILGMVPRWLRHRREALQARFAAHETGNAFSTEAGKLAPPTRPDGI